MFAIEARCDVEDLRRALESHLEAGGHGIVGEVTTRQCALAVVQESRRFWTPSLDLMFEGGAPDSAEPCTRVWGTFSPRAEIWTAFVFTIGSLSIISVFATVYGIARLVLGGPPYTLLVPVFAVVVAALLYAAALVGQGLSIAEMYRLRAFVDDCLRVSEDSASGERVSDDRVHEVEAADDADEIAVVRVGDR